MAANFYVEYNGMKAEEKNILEKVKTIWKDKGNRVKDMKKTDVYFKAEEGMCYYVINDDETGCFSISDL